MTSSLVASIIDMAKRINARVIAEGGGVEEQAAYLRKLNVEWGQG